MQPVDAEQLPLTVAREGFAQQGSYLVLTDTQFAHLKNPDSKPLAGRAAGGRIGGFEYAELTDVVVNGTRAGNGVGGILLDDVAYVWVRDSAFENVRHNYFGGGLMALGATEVLLTGANFTNCTATDWLQENEWHAASAFTLRDGQEPTVNVRRVRLDSVQVRGCFSTAEVVNVAHVDDVHVLNCNFERNRAWQWNSVLYFRDVQRAAIQASNFTENEVRAGNGGAISTGNTTVLRVSDCNFRRNKADDKGPLRT